ncbi:DMT family transporter [Lachnospiraceae bacterium C1.1]|nr:DMT family transporter [Lachnospiraceae bacterium C1.1]
MKEIKNRHMLAILLVIGEALGFALMSFFVRMSGDLPTMQKAFFRNAVAAVIAFVTLARSEEGFKLRTKAYKELFFRSLFGTTGLIMNFWAIDHLVIADANILNKMSPFFAIIMSIFILKELPNHFETIMVIIAFIGVLFIVQPTAGIASLPALVGLTSGFLAGTAYTFVRKLGIMGERGPVIVFCFSAFSVLVTLPNLIFNYKAMEPKQLLFLILAGTSAAAAQFCITKAYSLAPAKEISVFDYTQVLFAALIGICFLGEIPNFYSIIGYIIIIAASVIKWRYNCRED